MRVQLSKIERGRNGIEVTFLAVEREYEQSFVVSLDVQLQAGGVEDLIEQARLTLLSRLEAICHEMENTQSP